MVSNIYTFTKIGGGFFPTDLISDLLAVGTDKLQPVSKDNWEERSFFTEKVYLWKVNLVSIG